MAVAVEQRERPRLPHDDCRPIEDARFASFHSTKLQDEGKGSMHIWGASTVMHWAIK